jgi:plasmid stabilization system protein ParE
MRRLVLLDSAVDDLRSILGYITRESGSRATARTFVDALRAHCRKLARLPGTLGRARPELRPDIRSTPYRGYVIFFRYAADRLEIVNILEGHRDTGDFFTPT